MAQLKRKVSLKQKQQLIEPKKTGNRTKWVIGLTLLTVLIVVGYLLINNSRVKDSLGLSMVENTDDPVAQVDSQSEAAVQDSKGDENVSVEGAANENVAETGNVPESENAAEESAAGESGAPSSEPAVSQSENTTEAIPYDDSEKYRVYQFGFNESNYSQADPELDKLVKALKDFPDMKISITAFTDNIGSAEFNRRLSTQRAGAIYRYLVSAGIDRDRLSYKGLGISEKYDNSTEEGRSKNRRAEFELTM